MGSELRGNIVNNTFINKVAIERQILRSVNLYTKGARQLSGLSWSAIDIWQRAVPMQKAEPLVKDLKELSDLCQRISDRSHETFASIDPMLEQKIQSRIKLLNEHLKSAEKTLRSISK